MEALSLTSRSADCIDPDINFIVDQFGALATQSGRVYRTDIIDDTSKSLAQHEFATVSKDIHLLLGLISKAGRLSLFKIFEKKFTNDWKEMAFTFELKGVRTWYVILDFWVAHAIYFVQLIKLNNTPNESPDSFGVSFYLDIENTPL